MPTKARKKPTKATGTEGARATNAMDATTPAIAPTRRKFNGPPIDAAAKLEITINAIARRSSKERGPSRPSRASNDVPSASVTAAVTPKSHAFQNRIVYLTDNNRQFLLVDQY